jgi:hypothetical protein
MAPMAYPPKSKAAVACTECKYYMDRRTESAETAFSATGTMPSAIAYSKANQTKQ